MAFSQMFVLLFKCYAYLALRTYFELNLEKTDRGSKVFVTGKDSFLLKERTPQFSNHNPEVLLPQGL